MVVNHGILLSLHSPESLNTLIPHALEEYLLPTVNTASEPANTAIRYVQTLPGSSFWLSYRILLPPSPDLDTKLYVFKLFIGREHFTTWSVDEGVRTPEGRWRGRCMFGLFEDPSMVDHPKGGRKVFEKRAFSFAAPPPGPGNRRNKEHAESRRSDSGDATGAGRKKLKRKKAEDPAHPFTPPKSWAKRAAKEEGDERFIEVKVFRARGKKRIPRDVATFDKQIYDLNGGQGLDLKNAGYVARPYPRRFYGFDLIDPKDEPYTAFRFYYRTTEELKTLGIVMNGEYTPSPKAPSVDSQATITPEKASTAKTTQVSLKQRFEEVKYKRSAEQDAEKEDECNSSPLPISRQNTPEQQTDSPPATVKRLTIPPSIKLMPSLGSWRNSSYSLGLSEYDVALRRETASKLAEKASAETLRKDSNQGPWRAFHEEREAEHGGY